MADNHTQHSTHTPEEHKLHQALGWGTIGAGSIIAAPYVLPLIGIGDPLTNAHGGTHQIMSLLGPEAGSGALGTGLAGSISSFIAGIPLIGGALTSAAPMTIPLLGIEVATGAVVSTIAAGTIAIGGMFLADWMAKNEERGEGKIAWSSIVRTLAIGTSILISLPSLLAGVSIGLAFLASQFGGPVAGLSAIEGLKGGLGSTAIASTHGASAGGLVSLVPHLFTCGAAALPILGPMLGGMGKDGKASSEPKIEAQGAAIAIKNQPQTLRFSLKDSQLGFPLTPKELETKHTQKLHTMVVNQSLTDYHHLHPQFNPQSGLWEAEFTPRTQEKYAAWHDYTLCDTKQQFHTKTELPSVKNFNAPAPAIQQQNEAFADGYHVALNSGPIKSGEANMVTVNVTDASGKPVTAFTPIMGADAHLVGFTRDGNHMLHCHPTKTNGNALTFHIEPQQAGFTKFFLQMRPNGQEVTIPIGQYIQPASRMAERVTQSHAHHHAPAIA